MTSLLFCFFGATRSKKKWVRSEITTQNSEGDKNILDNMTTSPIGMACESEPSGIIDPQGL